MQMLHEDLVKSRGVALVIIGVVGISSPSPTGQLSRSCICDASWRIPPSCQSVSFSTVASIQAERQSLDVAAVYVIVERSISRDESSYL
jgi:hypothetical protein